MEDKFITFDWPEELKQLADEATAIKTKFYLKDNELGQLHRKSCSKFFCKKRCRKSDKENEILKSILKELHQNRLKAIEIQRNLPDLDDKIKDLLNTLEDRIMKSGIY